LTTVSTWSKRELAQLIERGEYVVDADVVAEAILRRLAATGSPVLVAPEALGGPAVLPDEHEARSRDDLP
jgi:hypothetical protein